MFMMSLGDKHTRVNTDVLLLGLVQSVNSVTAEVNARVLVNVQQVTAQQVTTAKTPDCQYGQKKGKEREKRGRRGFTDTSQRRHI